MKLSALKCEKWGNERETRLLSQCRSLRTALGSYPVLSRVTSKLFAFPPVSSLVAENAVIRLTRAVTLRRSPTT